MQDLEKFKNEMNLSGKNVYVGNRYAPVYLGDWDNSKEYEPLSIVMNQGDSFVSRGYVPTGVDIDNGEYWHSVGVYNAQLARYINDVKDLQDNIDETKQQFKNKIWFKDTVTDILNDENITTGDLVKTLGYYEIDNDAAGLYMVKDTTTNAHDIQLKEGLHIQPIFENNIINVKVLGAKADNVTDETLIFQKAFDGAENAETIYFPKGRYKTYAPLPSGKNVKYLGIKTNLLSYGSSINFVNCDGYKPTDAYNKIENLYLTGSKTLQDIQNNEIGHVGINLSVSPTASPSGFTCENVRVSNFNTGVAITDNEGGSWAGAYHDFYNLYLQYNDVNLYMKNGVTHTKFHGGINSRALNHGIYSINSYGNSSHYTNAEFFGVTIETNGNPIGDTGASSGRNMESKNVGIYVENSKINLIGSYLENEFVFAAKDGVVNLSNTHVHEDVRMWSLSTGSINTSQSLASFNHELRLHDSFEENNATLAKSAGIDIWGKGEGFEETPYFRTIIQGEALSPSVSMINYNKYNFTKVENIKFVKLSLNLKVLSGADNNDFKIDPRIYITSGTSNNTISYPMEQFPTSILDSVNNGDELNFSYYYFPSFKVGGINPNENVSNIYARLNLSESGKTLNYTNLTRLDIEIRDLSLKVFTDTDIRPTKK